MRAREIAKARKTHPGILRMLDELRKASRENNVRIWRDIAERLERPRRSYAEVNLSRINRYAREGETIVVAGKVLGAGKLDKRVYVAALGFSRKAYLRITALGGRCMSIDDLLKENPKGSGVRIMA
ncbi:MAG: 50S ribosomal protein L18e [Canidatus Methanoxibalbensis ujae]|nr:50S ribosomal protein L18e [Candidatus Methanoxibalbensis ujae]MCW7079418.1 50S ribosomal protein L18e [Candidatus Methanoxibalbensis ujae]